MQQQVLEVDTDDFEDEAAYATSIRFSGNSTASVTSSILRGVYENGRRYASYGKGAYGMPIDEAELDRMDMSHQLYSILLEEKLYLAPIEQNPQRVLDLGTGSGIWAMDMAEAYPSADVLGVDLAAMQPQWVPSNCHFEIDDVEEPWTFKKNSFDFIHSRDFLLSIYDWPKLISQCYEHLRPNGHLELQCLLPIPFCDDSSTPATSSLLQFSSSLLAASEICGWSVRAPNLFKAQLENAGFVDVVETRYKVPTAPWARDKRMKLVGAFMGESLARGASAMSLRAFSKAFGWSMQETEVFLVGLRRDVKVLSWHCYFEFVIVHGRKP